MSDIINALLNRVSSPKLTAPAPTPEHLAIMLDCARRAPDHGRLQPWHFIVMQGDGLRRLGEIFAAAKQQDGVPLDARDRDKLLNMPLRAPMVVVAVARLREHPKIPAQDQVMAVAAAVQNMQLAARALGYGVMWRTGEMAMHPHVKAALELSSQDEIVAFLYVGTSSAEDRPVSLPEPADCVTFWA